MKIVIDSNIAFSAMLHTDSKIAKMLFDGQRRFTFYTCYLLNAEIERHKGKIITLAEYSLEDFEAVKSKVFECLHFISEELVPFEYWQKALPLVRDIDIDDIAFVALSDFLEAHLWTGDKVLYEGLKAKGYAKVLSTQELLLF